MSLLARLSLQWFIHLKWFDEAVWQHDKGFEESNLHRRSMCGGFKESNKRPSDYSEWRVDPERWLKRIEFPLEKADRDTQH